MYTVRNAIARIPKRSLHRTVVRLAKNDSSTIDLYKLPSQTSINEWEFRYDFVPKVAEPKVPPVTAEAVKQDIAQEKAAQVAKELSIKEASSSMKIAGDAEVIHGGETVDSFASTPEPTGVPQTPKAPANRSKYVQSSINPDINKPEVLNLSTGDVSHNKASTEQSQVLEDVEHDDHHKEKTTETVGPSGTGLIIPVGIGAALGYFGYTFFFGEKSEK